MKDKQKDFFWVKEVINKNLAVLMAGGYIFADPIVKLLSGGGTSENIFTCVRAYIYGEEDTDTLKKALKISFRHALVLNGVVMVVLLIAASLFAGLYQSDTSGETYKLAVRAVRWYALCMPLYGVNIVFMNYLQGTGKFLRRSGQVLQA